MDGWKIAAVVEVCALCGRELPVKDGSSVAKTEEKKHSALAALLGEELPETVRLSGSSEKDFCHNCANFIEHPFQPLCALDGSAADPMGSCSKFRTAAGR